MGFGELLFLLLFAQIVSTAVQSRSTSETIRVTSANSGSTERAAVKEKEMRRLYHANEATLREFISLRAAHPNGDTSLPAVWLHEGVIRNARSGKAIAGIKGLELTYPLVSELQHLLSSSQTRLQNEYSNSNIKAVERAPPARYNTQSTAPLLRTSYSYLTRKMFVYVDNSNTSKPLTECRVRPYAPKRRLNPVSYADQIVTIGLDDVGRFVSAVEFPGGRKLLSKQVDINSISSSSGGRLKIGKKQQHFDVSHFMSAGKKQPLWSRFVSFAAVSNNADCGRSQEYYSISSVQQQSKMMRRLGHWLSLPWGKDLKRFKGHGQGGDDDDDNDDSKSRKDEKSKGTWKEMVQGSSKDEAAVAVMRFQRYGEAPWWVGLGGQCIVEMHSKKYQSVQDLPLRHLMFFQAIDETSFVSSCCGTTDGTGTRSALTALRDYMKASDPIELYQPWYVAIPKYCKRILCAGVAASID